MCVVVETGRRLSAQRIPVRGRTPDNGTYSTVQTHAAQAAWRPASIHNAAHVISVHAYTADARSAAVHVVCVYTPLQHKCT